MLANLKVFAKILSGFLVIAAVIFGAFAYMYTFTNGMSRDFDVLYGVDFIGTTSLLEADRDLYQSRQAMMTLIDEMVDKGEAFRLRSGDQPAYPDLLDGIHSNLEQVNTRFSRFEQLYLSDSREASEYFAVFRNEYSEMKKYTTELIQQIETGNHEGSERVFHSFYVPHFDALRDSMDQLTQIAGSYVETNHAQVVASYRNITLFYIVNCAGLVVLAVLLSFAIGRNIRQPIIELVARALRFSRGDFSEQEADRKKMKKITRRRDELGDMSRAFASMIEYLKTKTALLDRITRGDLKGKVDQVSEADLLGRSLKKMHEALKEIITQVNHASMQLAGGTEQISDSSQSLSSGANEQAASVEEISASIEEMSSTIQQNADNASQTEKIARKSALDAQGSGESVLKTVQAMRDIAEKISIVQEIARQTNLLSLNASIEAARAGEHGKGFAVVAEAVQKLAERSQQAADEISQLSKDSVTIAEQAGDMLTRLVPDIQKTADLVAEINAASTEQSKNTQQINVSIQQLNSVVQQNASSAEELASTAEEISGQALQLKEAVAYFAIDKTPEPLAAPAQAPEQSREKGVITGKPVSHSTSITLHDESGFKLDMNNPGDEKDQDYQPF